MRSHVLGALVALAATTAQAEEVPTADVKRDAVMAAPKEEGIKPSLTVGVNGSFNNNQDVIGVEDGWAVNVGLVVEGGLKVIQAKHDWQSTLLIQHTQTRTPPIERFVKSADAFKLRSLYVFHVVDWVGPFAQLKLDTQLAQGFAVKNDDVSVVRVARDGTASAPKLKPAQSSITLTSPFEPLILNQSVGAFARPVAKDLVTLDAKLGAGAQEIVVGDGYSLADDKATPELELKQLESANELGAVLELGGNGKLNEDVTWSASANFFLPVSPGPDAGQPEGFDRLNSDISAKLSVRLNKWASLDYVLSAKRVPLVLEKWQVTNGLLLNAGFTVL